MRGVKINYSKNELAYIKDNCTLPIAELHSSFVKKFKRDDVSIVNLNALRKRNSWRTGRTGFFQKGEQAWNKGMKGWSATGTEATRFKKGTKPPNYKPVGSTRIQSDGYVMMKMAEGLYQWKLLQRVVWERMNGKIPKGMVLIFLDGNKQNIKITNLSLYTRVQNMQRNTMHNYPKEIALAIQLQGAITRQINKRSKQNEQHRYA